MSEVKLLTRGRAVGGDGAPSRPVRREHLRHHPSSPEPRPSEPESAHGQPGFEAVGMVLLSAAAVLEGYQWLDVIHPGRLDLSAPVFALLSIPAALLLARAHRGPRHTWLTRLVVVSAAAIVVSTSLEAAYHHLWSARALGASDLLMAVSLFGSALAGGRFLTP